MVNLNWSQAAAPQDNMKRVWEVAVPKGTLCLLVHIWDPGGKLVPLRDTGITAIDVFILRMLMDILRLRRNTEVVSNEILKWKWNEVQV